MFCAYWMMNTVLGLFVINEFGGYLDGTYPDLKGYVLMFALKWFTSVGYALVLVGLFTIGSAVKCFTGDAEDIKALIFGMAFPIYCFCVIV